MPPISREFIMSTIVESITYKRIVFEHGVDVAFVYDGHLSGDSRYFMSVWDKKTEEERTYSLSGHGPWHDTALAEAIEEFKLLVQSELNK